MGAKERNALIAAAYEAGDEVSAIAALHGLAEGTVRNIIQGAGARRDASRARTRGAILAALGQGLKAKQTASALGVSVEWVRKVRANAQLDKAAASLSNSGSSEARPIEQ